MAIFLDKKLNVCDYLKEVNFIPILDKNKPYKTVGILNLMPDLEKTEKDILKLLDVPFMQIEVKFIYLNNFTNNPLKKHYLETFYHKFNDIKCENFDGMIITGAPLEHLEYEDIFYKKELDSFILYTKKHVKTTLTLCWASFYLLDYLYGIKKNVLATKLSGLYSHYIVNERNIVKGFDEYFLVPQSRYCGIKEEDVLLNKNLTLVSKSNISGAFIITSNDNKYVFVTGHLEYDKYTLEKEYLRDLNLQLKINKPINYYDNNNYIKDAWRSHATLLYHNWLMYYVM